MLDYAGEAQLSGSFDIVAGGEKLKISVKQLDLTHCPDIREVQVGYNKIASLDMSKCSIIRLLEVASSALTEVNLSGCTKLESLDVSMNQLTEIDLRRTAMKSIDLSKNKNVAFIFAEENPQLKTIYINPEAPINTISCDEHGQVYLYDPVNFDDVNSGNWGDGPLAP